jgi:hypothetical protein
VTFYSLPDYIKQARKLMGEPTCWTPAQIAAIPLPQFIALFGEHEGGPRYMDAAEQLAHWNEWRAKLGLPPIKSRRGRGGAGG